MLLSLLSSTLDDADVAAAVVVVGLMTSCSSWGDFVGVDEQEEQDVALEGGDLL